ncbi:spinster family MFS transporter [Niveispirillum fermenti]|uniref:spinster family MFS transporter n=1 Tax=Niveispirillum fermenti TaxID=1233113 RepID=UPI003A860404
MSTSPSEPDARYRYVVVAVLGFAYMLNFVDRQLLSILVEPVKQDLGLSDTQIGMLTGLMFALFYTFFGIPVAMIADRGNRTRLIAAACGIWSIFTALSGLATGFVSLALARIGVGIGEAGCSPPSYSIIADYFPAHKRGRALALYLLGVPAGSFVGAVAGAAIADAYGWRTAFVVIGLVGVLFAPLLLLIVREPVRGRFDAAAPSDAGPPRLMEALSYFWRSPIFIFTGLACGLTSFCSYGLLNWTPAFLSRVQGMSLGQISGYFGVLVAGSMVVAAWIGAMVADKAGARNPIWYALLPGLGMLLVVPFLFGFTMVDDWSLSLLLLVPPTMLTSIYLVPALALLQNRTPPQYRATVSATLLFLLNLLGLGCGPLFVGMVSDRLTPVYGTAGLAMALQWLTPFIILAFLCQAITAWLIRREALQGK